MVQAFTLSTQAFWLCLVRVHPAGVLNPKQTDSPLNLAGSGRCCPVPDLMPAVAPLPPPPLLLGPAEPFPLAADLFPLTRCRLWLFQRLLLLSGQHLVPSEQQ
jgi:hypothetical protein